jgi:hypothetical protein
MSFVVQSARKGNFVTLGKFEDWLRLSLAQLEGEGAEVQIRPDGNEMGRIFIESDDRVLMAALSGLVAPVREAKPISMPRAVLLPPCF